MAGRCSVPAALRISKERLQYILELLLGGLVAGEEVDGGDLGLVAGFEFGVVLPQDCLLVDLVVFDEVDAASGLELAPEEGHAAPDADVHHQFVVALHDFLSFDEVGRVALGVDPSAVEPCT
jgi:hypothetical protein